MIAEKLNFQPLQHICDDNKLRCQKEVAEYIKCSLTKIKEIENGTIKDFNALNNYLNYLGCGLIF